VTRALLFVVVGLQFFAVPARAADEVLASLPSATGLSAYGGWVVFSAPTGTGTWTLKAWRDGVVVDVPIRPRMSPFDVDVGPDASGQPTAVYSRCATEASDVAPEGCDVYAVALGGGQERRLAVSTSRHSEFAPSIWRGLLSFGRLSPNQRKADIFLARTRKPLGRLGPGRLAPCQELSCDGDPSQAWPERMDLGPRAVAYLWILRGGDVYGVGPGLEVRGARLDGSRSRLAQTGFFGGACEFAEVFSPNVSGTRVLYGLAYGDACSGNIRDSFRRFDLTSARRTQAREPGPATVTSLAWDGTDVYSLRRTGAPSNCHAEAPPCPQELVRFRGLAFRGIKGGEASTHAH